MPLLSHKFLSQWPYGVHKVAMEKGGAMAIGSHLLGLCRSYLVRFGAGALAGALLLAGCGGGYSSPTTTTTIKHPSNSAVTAEITTHWIAFFNGVTSATQKIALLENGAEFAAVINGQAASAMAKSVTAKVLRVSGITTNSAHVRYDVYLGSTKALSNQSGTAIKQGGSWKVSDASFCVLLGLEQVTVPMCPTS